MQPTQEFCYSYAEVDIPLPRHTEMSLEEHKHLLEQAKSRLKQAAGRQMVDHLEDGRQWAFVWSISEQDGDWYKRVRLTLMCAPASEVWAEGGEWFAAPPSLAAHAQAQEWAKANHHDQTWHETDGRVYQWSYELWRRVD